MLVLFGSAGSLAALSHPSPSWDLLFLPEATPRRIHHWTPASRKPGPGTMCGARLERGMEGRTAAVMGHRVPGVCCSHSGVTEIPPPPAPRLRPVWVTGVSPAFRLLLLHVQAPPASTAPQGPSRVPSKRLLGRHVCAMCRPSRALLGHPGRASGVGCSASEGKDGDRGPWQRPGNSLPRGTGLGSPFASAFAGSSFWNGCCVGLLM